MMTENQLLFESLVKQLIDDVKRRLYYYTDDLIKERGLEMSGMLGKNIKSARKARGITQEELGRLIGVTTQAVSKWECGGTPDAELLPAIASNLGVSVDALFGKTEEVKQDLTQLISYELLHTSAEERFEKAFSFCWAIELGLTGVEAINDSIVKQGVINTDNDASHEYYSKILVNHGITDMKISKNGRYFFIMPEPADGIKSALGDISEYADTFRLLSDERVLKIIMYMYSRKNTAVTSSLIAKNTGLSEETVKKLMDKMCDYSVADKIEIETDGGMLYSYQYRQECTMIPLLCLAKELRVREMLDIVMMMDRDNPIL